MQSIYYPFDFLRTFKAYWREILFETNFAVQTVVFFYETHVLQWAFAFIVSANEMFWTPNLAESSNKRSSI